MSLSFFTDHGRHAVQEAARAASLVTDVHGRTQEIAINSAERKETNKELELELVRGIGEGKGEGWGEKARAKNNFNNYYCFLLIFSVCRTQNQIFIIITNIIMEAPELIILKYFIYYVTKRKLYNKRNGIWRMKKKT